MKQFLFKADCTFNAENLDDALRQISKHFRNLDKSKFEFIGKISVEVPLPTIQIITDVRDRNPPQ